MRASFFGLNIASTSLNTARSAMNVTAHNIANVGTIGYSRQVAVQRASRPMAMGGRAGMVGTGSEVIGIQQIRSLPLDHRFWNENPVLGKHAARTGQLTMIEAGFGELDGVGLTSTFSNFFDTIQELHTNPSDPTLQNSFVQGLENMTRMVSDRANALLRQQQDINREIGSMVSIINNIGDQIANLSEQITRAEIRGDAANDLRDQRAVLVDELSGLVNIDVTETNVNGRDRFMIHIDGQQFVSDGQVTRLDVQQRTVKRHEFDAEGLYDITIGGRPFRMGSSTLSGELRGLLDMRDGNATRDEDGNLVGELPAGQLASQQLNDFRGIPYYLERLNQMVNTIANAFNFGVDANGDPIPGNDGGHMNGFQPGSTEPNPIPLFGQLNPAFDVNFPFTTVEFLDDGTPNPNFGVPATIINPFNFAINPDIKADIRLLNTSFSAANEEEGGDSSASLIKAFMEIGTYESLFREGTVNDFINAVTGEIAMDLRDAFTFTESQTTTMEIVQNQRLSIMGVDMNEEMTNVIFLQQHFQASSRLISTFNDIYDNMINRMGV